MVHPAARRVWLGAFALALVQLSEGCSCMYPGLSLCEILTTHSDLLLHGTVVSSNKETIDINELVTYEIEATTIYKQEPDVQYSQAISFQSGSSAMCGYLFNVDEEWLVDLRATTSLDSEGNQSSAFITASCGATKVWSFVSEDDKEILRNGCDPCESTCHEFQECLYYEGDYGDREYYCADVCDPRRCGEAETCTLQTVNCVSAPCPPLAVCEVACNSECEEYETCTIYDGEGYCSSTCEEGACPDGQQCQLEEKMCCGDSLGCPMRRTCHDL